MKRTIIKIDEELCNGCGACVTGCHEGALQLIDGKARMISDFYCDGLGACIGECPVGAIEFETREAEPYNEYAVMERISPKGEKTIHAHLLHLKTHNEIDYVEQGLEYLKEHNIQIDLLGIEVTENNSTIDSQISSSVKLRQWPIQLHLLNPQTSYFKGADVVLAADCTAYAYRDFHNKFLKNHILAIACPKLDSNKESYIEKLTAMIDHSLINTLSVVIMEVPCCGGLLQIAQRAVSNAKRRIPVKLIIIGVEGNLLKEEWV